MSLPEIGYVRVWQIIGRPAVPATADKPAVVEIPAVIPVSSATWWRGVKSGRFPAGIKMSPGVTVWPVEAIRSLVVEMRQVAA